MIGDGLLKVIDALGITIARLEQEIERLRAELAAKENPK